MSEQSKLVKAITKDRADRDAAISGVLTNYLNGVPFKDPKNVQFLQAIIQADSDCAEEMTELLKLLG